MCSLCHVDAEVDAAVEDVGIVAGDANVDGQVDGEADPVEAEAVKFTEYKSFVKEGLCEDYREALSFLPLLAVSGR